MPVLIVAAISFLVFCLTSLLISVAARLESRHVYSIGIPGTRKAHPMLFLAEAFDPVYAILWEAPIAALRLLDSAGHFGVPVPRLRPIFDKAAACFPEIYEGYSFSQWLKVLEKNQFIAWTAGRVKLTPEGKAFLNHRFISDVMMEAEEDESEEAPYHEFHVE